MTSTANAVEVAPGPPKNFFWRHLTNHEKCAILSTETNEREKIKMTYEVYPCDLDPMGECPKRCQDCAYCVGWNFPPEEDEED